MMKSKTQKTGFSVGGLSGNLINGADKNYNKTSNFELNYDLQSHSNLMYVWWTFIL